MTFSPKVYAVQGSAKDRAIGCVNRTWDHATYDYSYLSNLRQNKLAPHSICLCTLTVLNFPLLFSDLPSVRASGGGGEPEGGGHAARVRAGQLCALHIQRELELGHAQGEHRSQGRTMYRGLNSVELYRVTIQVVP